MGERRPRRGSLRVHFDYAFDRLGESKLAQAYDILAPARQRLAGVRLEEGVDEDGRDLRSSVVGATTRGTHDRESDGGVDRVCKKPRSGGAEGVGVRRRRF